VPTESQIDALLPPEMARLAEAVGVRKAALPADTMLALAVLAGAFIALGAMLATIALTGTSTAWPFGASRLLAGGVFSLGLILVVVGGAELFTGNSLLVMAWCTRKVSARAVLRSWGIVYFGNFVGALATALLCLATGQYTAARGAVGAMALSIATAKLQHSFVELVAPCCVAIGESVHADFECMGRATAGRERSEQIHQTQSTAQHRIVPGGFATGV
jgi:formate transporter